MDWLSFGECTANTVMSVLRPKMKRDAGVKCCLFDSKKTAFHSSVSLHFWATNGRYGFTWIGHLPYLVSYFSGATLFARFKKPSHLFPRSVFRWQCGVWEMHDDIFARR